MAHPEAGLHPRIALTFHGQGDPATAQALLTEAERHGAHVTVLAVGIWLDAHPALAHRIRDAGHDLGNHTHRHLDINAMPEADPRRRTPRIHREPALRLRGHRRRPPRRTGRTDRRGLRAVTTTELFS
ncbi:hypothetical protein AQJ91_44750 [Streptomyces dysideae]|uniref:NodB homology domain-containing protein n=1 Tax=Streptomyces dysideae TaxID=909626 RepID=A0A101UQ81_9ACTN|nr:hypothetical protein AQJ91_44750 [Streptomyces dysideae]